MREFTREDYEKFRNDYDNYLNKGGGVLKGGFIAVIAYTNENARLCAEEMKFCSDDDNRESYNKAIDWLIEKARSIEKSGLCDVTDFDIVWNTNKIKCDICGIEEYPRILTRIIDKNKKQVLCPFCVTKGVLDGTLDTLEEDPGFVDDITGQNGAIKISNGDDEYSLNKETLLRLLGHCLTKAEYKILTEKYSEENYLLHEDFYDDEGNALCPIL